ncbi:Esterase PHB depolymerase family protein [Penicillium ucsense]|uniref:Esterase PHB depolymerase family protein n=1 Tax=Penicillium ucsense TaxID=2839758 RepID=A0A8J8VZ08_9EURO|nr:Esterase PHB depolymerase family protein [Penicillium ucsense]KAF7732997.1 Esterase PHB depolymerase family protein [Penicillium ucsense]
MPYRSALVGLASFAGATTAASTLGAYNVDPSSVSVSGLSSGGFFSAQLGVAYSNVFQTGFGVFAGGPFDCARNQAYTSCMYNGNPSITTPIANMKSWSGNQIAPTSNLKNRKIYLWTGSADTTVGPNVMNALNSQLSNFDTSADVSYVTTSGAVHTFPTDFSGSGDNSCSMSSSPYISNCNYDGAGAVLQWMYGSLNARNTGTLSGSIVSFAQTGAYGAAGMDSTGYLYVPASCQGGSTVCKLHVALHGCLQSYSNIQMEFVQNTGYNKWADTNNIIILYPQAIPDNTIHSTWGGSLSNPNGCWDWVGWYGSNADQIGGVQMVAIVNQVAQIISGNTGGGSTQPSTMLTTTTKPSTTTTSAAGSPTGAPLYGQCGGFGWTGPTTCAQGVCTAYSAFYAQCLLPL